MLYNGMQLAEFTRSGSWFSWFSSGGKCPAESNFIQPSQILAMKRFLKGIILLVILLFSGPSFSTEEGPAI